MQSSDPAPPPLPRFVASLLTLVFLAVLVRTAWISDDALITLRTVLNVTNGFGLTFNIAERVQTFTHPLWMALLTLAYLVIGNVYHATFVLAMGCAATAFWLAIRHAATTMQAVLVVIVLLWSRAFVDFSTSGLENPLAYVLVALFAVVYTRGGPGRPRWLTALWTLTGLMYLTRPDGILLMLPLLALACWRTRRPAAIAAAAAVGLAAPLAWTLFSLVYYGFPFPNTAYAKLAMDISGAELREQGLLYLLDSIDRDPLTLTTIAFAVLLAVRAARRVPAAGALAAGILLYLAYVVSIGGDFMAGRFMAVPLFCAALLAGWFVTAPRALWAAAAGILLVIGSASLQAPLWSNSRFDDSAAKPNGIVDERGVYFNDRSLVRARRGTFRNPNWPSAA
ncbi:MAG TPA: hypothetical protein VM364_23355 [Vicinamibacterales bacterium]|nr:hypothetical protein [Vicinamibacterales bacterium]